VCFVLQENPSQSYVATPLLPATDKSERAPPLPQAGKQALHYPGGMKGWVDLGGWLRTEMVYLPADVDALEKFAFCLLIYNTQCWEQ